MYIQKITPKARLKGLTGSEKVRNSLAERLHARGMLMIDDVFSKKEKKGQTPHVQKSEIASILSTITEGKKIPVKPSESPSVSYNLPVVKGFKMNLPFEPVDFFSKKSKKTYKRPVIFQNDYKKLGSFSHELTHLTLAYANPKYVSKQILNSLPKSKAINVRRFYKRTLYNNETKKIPFALFFKDTDKLNNLRMEYIKNEINVFLKKENFSKDEIIPILQALRYGLKGELKSYQNGIKTYARYLAKDTTKKYATHPKYINNKKALEIAENKFIKSYIESEEYEICEKNFFFSKKINVIEQMIVEEMEKAGHDIRRFSQKMNKK